MLNYLQVPFLNRAYLKLLFSKIAITPSISWNGTSCWIWTGRTDKGYGFFRYKARSTRVHRLMFAWLVHPIPRGRQHGELDHLCKRPACCNPIHLDFVTAQINCLRSNSPASINARKTHCKHGHPLSGDNLLLESGGRKCRTCRNKRAAEYHQKYPEKHREACNRWCRKNREARTEYRRRWRAKNPNYFRDLMRKKRAANPEAYNLYMREYQARKKAERLT